MEEITEREKAAEKNRENVNKKKENDKVTAEEMRKKSNEKDGPGKEEEIPGR